jgi:hypothetical protein
LPSRPTLTLLGKKIALNAPLEKCVKMTLNIQTCANTFCQRRSENGRESTHKCKSAKRPGRKIQNGVGEIRTANKEGWGFGIFAFSKKGLLLFSGLSLKVTIENGILRKRLFT